jgi:hypothetical protein
VIQTLPRGAAEDPERAGYIRYDLEGSLWMVFYENLSHIRTMQRFKRHQQLPLAVELPRVGSLRLPEYGTIPIAMALVSNAIDGLHALILCLTGRANPSRAGRRRRPRPAH